MLPWGESPPTSTPAAAVVDPMIGMAIGSFQVVKVLGRGGMGTVYLGEQTVIGSKVAIKILHDHLASNPSLVARFYAEARAVNLIGHENIVNIFDMNVIAPNRYYLIMEFLEGRALNALARGPVAPEIVVPILTQVCDALEAAHTHGVVHRDLKPENIFLIKRGRNENFAKILDFGIAKLFATDVPTEETAAGMIVGTPEYMAPEQCTGEKIDGRVDLYALGVIAYQLTTGKLPFSGGGLTGLLIAHQTKIAVPPHEVNPNISLELSAVIMRSLAKRPDDRYQTAEKFAAALEFAVPPAAPGGRTAIRGVSVPPQAAVVAAAPVPKVALNVASKAGETPLVPSRVSTPLPVHARHTATFDAKVTTLDGKSLGTLKCQDISKGGCFLCTAGVAPALFVRLKVIFPVAGNLECIGEVIRHVTKDQADAWGMLPGFGVQFATLTAMQKEALGRVVQGLPAATVADPPKSDKNDPTADAVLVQFRKRINGDHYVVLALANDAELSEVRARGREVVREFEGLRARALSTEQKAQLETALARIHTAVAELGSAQARLPFDAHRGNFKGVARCIAAGLTVTLIDAVRANFLSSHPGVDAKAQLKFLGGNAYETNNDPVRAIEHYEDALMLDPLNLRYQQRYWALKRRGHQTS